MDQSAKPSTVKFSPDGDSRILVNNYFPDRHGIVIVDTVAIIHINQDGGLEVESIAPLGPNAKATILAWWNAEDLGSKAIA